jgi:hypothetical protein
LWALHGHGRRLVATVLLLVGVWVSGGLLFHMLCHCVSWCMIAKPMQDLAIALSCLEQPYLPRCWTAAVSTISIILLYSQCCDAGHHWCGSLHSVGGGAWCSWGWSMV